MKKAAKSKSTQSALSVEQDIVGLVTTLVQKLVILEGKIDAVLSRLPEKAVEAPRRPQAPIAPAHQPSKTRPMFQVICADCGKHCEVPFKPNPGRSVYCRECFARRKANGNNAPRVETKPVETAPAQRPVVVKTAAVKVAAPPAAKKKPAAAKKTKKKAAKK